MTGTSAVPDPAAPSTVTSLDRDLHTVRSPGHQPQSRAVQRRISRNPFSDVGRRRRGRPRIPVHREHEHAPSALRGKEADGDLSETRYHAGAPDDHANRVGSRRALEVRIGTADVRRCDERDEGDQRLHRRNRAIQLPHQSAIRADATAMSAAMASAVGVTGLVSARQKR
jgi:hypothetical protein